MKLSITNLAGERAGRIIFSDVSFTLNEGEILTLTGANGSGKSTLLRVICGLLPMVEGQISISADVEKPGEAMHYLGHLNALKPALTIGENLLFWQEFCGNPLMSITDALAAVHLPDIDHLPAGYLSAGQKRRVSIAKLLVSFKPVWIVDEPTAALDKASQILFANLAKAHLSKGGIVIAATHKPLGLGKSKTLNMDKQTANDTRNLEYLA